MLVCLVRSNAGTTGLLIWAVTLAGILGGGALLVYSTSALAN
jgi:photosystem II protein